MIADILTDTSSDCSMDKQAEGLTNKEKAHLHHQLVTYYMLADAAKQAIAHVEGRFPHLFEPTFKELKLRYENAAKDLDVTAELFKRAIDLAPTKEPAKTE